MPIYEYRCLQCDQRFERLGRLNDNLPGCPLCGGETEKLLSAPGAIRVGSSGSEGEPCCGTASPCDNPRHCCGKDGGR